MKNRATAARWIVALSALFLAPLAEASLTRATWPAIEPPAPTLNAPASEPSEFSLFEGTELATAATESNSTESFHPLAAVSLLDEHAQRDLATSLEPSYPKTRYRVFGLLGTPILGELRGVSLELHWRSASFSCGLASGTVGWLSQDPLGDQDSVNLYGFVGMRPHEKTDPLGLWSAHELWGIGLDAATGTAIDVGHGVANVATAGVYGGVRRAQARGELDGTVGAVANAGAQGVANLFTLGLYGTTQETLEEGGSVGQALKVWAGDVSGYTDIAHAGTKFGEGEYLEGTGHLAGGTSKIAGWIVGGSAAYARATNQPLVAFGKNLGGSGTYRDAGGRLRDAKTNRFVEDPKTPPIPEIAEAETVHANSLKTKKPAQGYTLTDRNSGEPLHYGETTQGKKRYAQKYLEKHRAQIEFGPSGTKKEMHDWQHTQIEDYKAATGSRPPLNKNDY